MKNIITCDFAGQLGNNLIQLAAMIGYSVKYNIPYAIPRNYKYRNIYRHFKHLPLFSGNARRLQGHREPSDFSYSEIPQYHSPAKLIGFYQSEKYFIHAREEVLSAWRFKRIDGLQDVCSIHVRRGDYVKYSDSFPPVDMRYISLSMALAKELGFKKFYVFSDDLAWCMQSFGLNGFQFSSASNPYEDLCLMSSCGANIIANSTFSWVAAWANTSHDKVVISPHKDNWFGSGAKQLETKDLIPESWKQIKFRNSYRDADTIPIS